MAISDDACDCWWCTHCLFCEQPFTYGIDDPSHDVCIEEAFAKGDWVYIDDEDEDEIP